jgi:integrase
MTTAKRVVLTDRYLKSLKPAPAAKRIVHWDAAKPSFGCRITDRGVISFFVMRRMQGKPQPVRVVLGRYPEISLATARKLATAALGALVSGVHPKVRAREERVAAGNQQANTFAALAEQFLRRPAAAKQRTASEIEKTINRHLIPRWGARVASEIKRSDVIAMLEAIDAGSGPYMAAKALALASEIYRFGITRELGGLENNPCHLIKPSDFVGKMEPRQRVLTDAEIALVWQATEGETRRRNGTEIESTYPAGSFVRLLLLTAVRRSEAARMTWDEVDLDNALWVIPAHRTKSGALHEVPLSGMAVNLLRSLPRFVGNFVFSTNGGRAPIKGFGKFKDSIDERIAELAPTGMADWRFHDLRRTARTNLASLGVSPFIAELVIGHQQKGVHKVYDVHRYQSEKRDALDRWAAKLGTIIEPTRANVVALKPARAV